MVITKKNRYKFRKKLKKAPVAFSLLLPNIITLFGLCCGITSLKFALNLQWELAIIAIFFAAFFDVIDGSVARMLKASSVLGAQLDSLSDFMCFGVAPAFIVYLWKFNNFGLFGWLAIIIFILCVVIRLARFNADSIENQDKYEWQKMFFQGIPSTAAGMLILLPIIFSLDSDWSLLNLKYQAIILPLYMICIAFAAVSKIPTFSVKKLKISRRYASFVMIGIGMIVILLISYPWKILPIILIGYLCSIPVSIFKYLQLKKANQIES